MMKASLLYPSFLFSLLVVLGAVPAVHAEVAARDDVLRVYPGLRAVPITYATLEDNDSGWPSGVRSHSEPRYGSLVVQSDGLIYSPDSAFWSIGTDVFTYSTELCEPSSILCTMSSALVVVQAYDGVQISGSSGFETGVIGEGLEVVDPASRVSVSAAAGLVGGQGLTVAGPLSTDGYVRLAPRTGDPSGDASQQGSGAQATFHLPDPPPSHPGNTPSLSDGRIVLLSGGPADDPIVELTLQIDASQQRLALESPLAAPGPRPAPGILLSAQPHRATVTWWPSNNTRNAGASLLLDGQRVAELQLLPMLGVGKKARLGIVDPTTSFGGTLYLDEVQGGSFFNQPRREILRQDGFEPSAGFGSWGRESPIWLAPGIASAAIAGQGGLEAALAGISTGGFVTTELNALDGFGVGFELDPRSINIGPTGRVLMLEMEAPPLGSVLRLSLVPAPSGYELRAIVRQADGNWLTVPAAPIADTAHGVDIDWRAAQSARTQDGSVRLWVDGNLAAEVSGLANAGMRAHFVRVGGQALFADAFGKLAYDNVVIRH